MDQPHRVKGVEHVRRPIHQFGPGPRQGRGLKAAAEFLGLLVERPDADVRMLRLVAGDLVGEKLSLVRPRLVPDRHHLPGVMRPAARRSSRE